MGEVAMLMDLFAGLPFYLLWPVLATIAVAWYLLLSGGLYVLLHRSSYAETARRFKTQLRATQTSHVWGEARDGVLSMVAGALCVAIAFWCARHGYGQLYASPADHSLWVIPLSVVGVFVVMEVFEWAFHRACHRSDLLWKVHKHHHRYANPTPFGVMADHPLDMFIKASPIFWIPFLFPIWDVALIGTFATLNLLYGTYLHAGFDPPWMPSPHSRVLLSAWHHNEHHAGSLEHNYGFYTGVMDILFGTRLTPSDKARARSGYRCTECREDPTIAPALGA